MGKKEKKADFHKFVKDKKLPILTLDARWHELFPEDYKTAEIRELEQKVNNLLKKQGKLVNDIKDMKKLKKDLLKDIVVNMDIGRDLLGKAKEKKLDRNKQYIHELNEKLEAAEEELAELPYLIKEQNEALVAASVKVLYKTLESNNKELSEVAKWIADIREELKEKILIKHDLEERNTKIYTYMHDIFGVEVMEILDREHKN